MQAHEDLPSPSHPLAGDDERDFDIPPALLRAATGIQLVARKLARRVRDERGETWQVFERLLGDESRPRLVFESVCAVRCVTRYPATWRDLGDRELLALSRAP